MSRPLSIGKGKHLKDGSSVSGPRPCLTGPKVTEPKQGEIGRERRVPYLRTEPNAARLDPEDRACKRLDKSLPNAVYHGEQFTEGKGFILGVGFFYLVLDNKAF